MRCGPGIQVIAPWREERFRDQFPGRQAMIDYCAAHKIPVEATAKKPYSMDRNLLHISFEGGILEDPWNEPPADMFKLSVSPEQAPNKPEYVEVDFVRGRQRGGGRRPEADRAGRDADPSSTSRAASTAWAASTWSRTASWA
jgi:argininosuccinate synthase